MIAPSSVVAQATPSPTPQPAAVVHIKNFAFVPARLTVRSGETIVFINDDDEAHTATSTTRAFDSGGLDAHERWETRLAGNLSLHLRATPDDERNDRRPRSGAGAEAMKRDAFLAHVGWTGAGLALTLGADGLVAPATAADTWSFVQISDSHIGFTGGANPDVAGTLKNTVAAINALPVTPAFVMHTGDVTHLAKAAQFADAQAILGALRAPLLVIPGEHDTIGSSGLTAFSAAFSRRDAPDGWSSWDHNGVHFIALVNVFNFETMGLLGEPQLTWLRADLASRRASTPIVVFTHVPLYALYPPWGWTTQDGAAALALLRRFDNVTVLSGHIRQVIEQTEGTVRFRTAAATAYPQPAPGTAAAPGPLVVEPTTLLQRLGYRTVTVAGLAPPVAVDHPLQER